LKVRTKNTPQLTLIKLGIMQKNPSGNRLTSRFNFVNSENRKNAIYLDTSILADCTTKEFKDFTEPLFAAIKNLSLK